MVIKTTKSLCHTCLEVIEAEIIYEANKVYFLKKCPKHGTFKTRYPWSNIEHYYAIEELKARYPGYDFADGLIINLNSDCNQNCPFCFASANEYTFKNPSLEEIKIKIEGFKGSSVYLCGGEPTIREDLFQVVSLVKSLGYRVFLFTNGKKLVDLNYAKLLREHGLDMVILQFDTLDEDRSEIIRGERLVKNKLTALDNLREAHIPVYLFVMLAKGINLDEIRILLNYAVNNSDIIKIINFNPVWEMGRVGYHEELDASEIIEEIERRTILRLQDFTDCTSFSYYLFELLRKIIKKGGRKHPMCEMRCYIIAEDSVLTPLTQNIDLKKINVNLKELNEILDSRKGFKKILKFLLRAGFIFPSIVKNKYVIKLIMKIFIKMLSRIFHTSFKFNMISLIVGTFHTEKSIDFDMVNTCNLFSDSEGGNISSCLRQISYIRTLNIPKG